jgi:hypothetical protein
MRMAKALQPLIRQSALLEGKRAKLVVNSNSLSLSLSLSLVI